MNHPPTSDPRTIALHLPSPVEYATEGPEGQISVTTAKTAAAGWCEAAGRLGFEVTVRDGERPEGNRAALVTVNLQDEFPMQYWIVVGEDGLITAEDRQLPSRLPGQEASEVTAEMEALRVAAEALATVSPEARVRVLRYLAHRFNAPVRDVFPHVRRWES